MDASETLRQFLGSLRTEPLSASDLARLFGMSRNSVKPDLIPTLDVIEVGSRYRVALQDMPLSYFRELNALHGFARSCMPAESAIDQDETGA